MKISFDPDKDKKNVKKHSVSLSEAAKLDWDLLMCAPDSRRDYGELREIGFAPIERRVFNVVFVQRNDELRTISLRKANFKEVIDYDQALKAHGVHSSNP